MERMEKDLERKLEDFRRNVTQVGERVVFHTFPNKIIDLTQLLQSTTDPESPFHPSNASRSTDTTVYPPPTASSSADEPRAKKRKLENGGSMSDAESTATNDLQSACLPSLVRSNKHMAEKVHGIVKGECEELATLVDQVKLWVTLTLPKIEDGDNFGVQIQEEVLGELHRAQESAYNLRDTTRQDYIARAKLCSKLIKYPNLEDYKLALQEHDEKQLYLARQHLCDLRNVYAVLTDLIHKNITKIRAPKAYNSVGLY